MMSSAWMTTTIGGLSAVARGASPRPIASPRWFDNDGEVRWIRIADVNRSDGRTLRETTQALSSDGIARSRYLKPGTLIMSIAATVGIPVITGVPSCIHDGFVALEDLKADKRFMLYLLKASEVRLREAGQSGSQMNVNSEIVRGLQVTVPSDREEQIRISSALWEADELIDALGRAIAKKRDIKQGMMQELLTGRTRLEGFDDPWVEGRLGALYERNTGTVDPRLSRTNEFQHFSIPAFDAGGQPMLEAGASIDSVKFTVPQRAVLVSKLNPRISRVWAPIQISATAIASTEFVVVVPAPGVSRSFLKWLMKSHHVAGRMTLLATGTTKSHVRIQPSAIADMDVAWPASNEQQAIASVLDCADDEIAALERRLESTRAIKQGMMQELLTGRTRLPVAEEVSV